MMIDQFNGSAPTQAELSAAPVVDRWQLISNENSTTDVSGFVSGHAKIRDGDFITTSALSQIDPSSPPGWVRTKNSIYRLATPAGAAESQVREIAREVGVRPRAWDILAYVAIVEELSGKPEGEIDVIEQLIAVLFRHGFVKLQAAEILLSSYRKERA